MAGRQILLDTNAYLRLAEKINPLLNTPFGKHRTRLFVIRQFESEFKSSARLRTDFDWVMEPKYVLNRKKYIRIPRDKKRTIRITERTLIDHVRTHGLGVSGIDCAALATGRVLEAIVVTDDRDMRRLADTFGIRTMRSLALMGQMLRDAHIDIEAVHETVLHWQETGDCPASFRADYRRIFGGYPPIS